MALSRVVLITNNPAPYRVPVFNEVAQDGHFQFTVFFSTEKEPNRAWDFGQMRFEHLYLKSSFLTWKDNFIHANTDVLRELRKARPDLLILGGFSPTNLLAFLYARLTGCKVGMFIDGTDHTEQRLSRVHRLLRRWVYPHVRVAFGPSQGTFRLFSQFGVPRERMFTSHLCADNRAFAQAPKPQAKDFDFIFCGRFAPEKCPDFALHVAQEVAQKMGRPVSVLMVGSGPMDAQLREQAGHLKQTRVHFVGFAQQAQLPALYAQARVSLFPSAGDAWGVVANEACASGVPVVVSPQVGAAGELVLDGITGFVRPIALPAWVEACVQLLSDEPRYRRMSQSCLERVQGYTYEQAAAGLVAGVRSVL